MSSGKDDVKPTVTFTIKDQANKRSQFKMKLAAKMGKAMKAYASKWGLNLNELRFQLNDTKITQSITAAELGIEDGDEIIAVSAQVGGGFA